MAECARTIVIAYDLTIQSEDALDFYCDQIRKEDDFVILINCTSRVGSGQEQTRAGALMVMVQEEINRIDREKKIMKKELQKRKLVGKVINVLGDIVEKLAETTKQRNVALVIVGSRFIGEKTREQTGSTKSRIVQCQQIEVPILIVKKPGVGKTSKERIAVLGTDLKKPSLNAMEFFKENIYGDEYSIHLVYCPTQRVKNVTARTYPPPKHAEEMMSEEKARLNEDTARLSNKLTELGMKGQVVTGELTLSPGQSIVQHAESVGANLVVLGSRCVGETTRRFAGESTSDFVLNACKMSVLVVKF